MRSPPILSAREPVPLLQDCCGGTFDAEDLDAEGVAVSFPLDGSGARFLALPPVDD